MRLCKMTFLACPTSAILSVCIMSISVMTWPFNVSENILSLSNETQELNASRLDFETSIENGIARFQTTEYSILDIIARSWVGSATNVNEFEFFTVRLLDPKKRRVVTERTFHGHKWFSFPAEPYIPQAAVEPTWYWRRENYTLKKAFKQLVKSGVRATFSRVAMSYTWNDPSGWAPYWQVCYQFYVDNPREPDFFYGVGTMNGIVFRSNDTKVLLRPTLSSGDANTTNPKIEIL